MSTTQNIPFLRHRGPITCAVQIPSSEAIITAGYDNAVGLFYPNQADNKLEVELLGYHQHLVNRVTVNATGSRAVTASSDYNLYVWDLASKELIRVLRGHDDDVEDFVFISDKLGASVSRDWRIIIWNLDNGAIERILLGHQKDVLSISYHDGKLYTTGDDMTLRTWDVQTGEQLNVIGPFETETDTCAIDMMNKRMVLGCDDGVIRVFDINSHQLLQEIVGHTSAIKKVAVSPETGDILSAAYDQQILIWDCHTFACKQRLQSQPSLWERSFNFSTDGKSVVAGTFDGTVLVWDASTGRCTHEVGKTKALPGNACFNDLASQDGDKLVLVSDDGHIRVASLNQQTAAWHYDKQPGASRVLMNAVTVCDDGHRVIAGAHNQRLSIYEQNDSDLSLASSIALNEGPINCIRTSYLPGYERDIFVACYSGTLAHLSADGSLLNKIPAHDNAIKALALHPTRPIGVSCCAEGGLTSWSFAGDVLQEYKGHTAIIDDVDIDPTGELIASAGRDFTLKIHRLDDGVLLHSIHLGRRSPKSLCFVSPDVVIVTNYWGELLRVSLRDQTIIRRTIANNGISSIIKHGEHYAVSSYDGGVYLVEQQELRVLNSLSYMQQQVQAPAYA